MTHSELSVVLAIMFFTGLALLLTAFVSVLVVMLRDALKDKDWVSIVLIAGAVLTVTAVVLGKMVLV